MKIQIDVDGELTELAGDQIVAEFMWHNMRDSNHCRRVRRKIFDAVLVLAGADGEEKTTGGKMDQTDKIGKIVTRVDVEALAHRANQSDLSCLRRGAWRVWSDGEVTTDGRGPLCGALSGAVTLGYTFPHAANIPEIARRVAPHATKVAVGSFAWVTRRDALVIRDAMMVNLGMSQVARRRTLAMAAGVATPADRLTWPALDVVHAYVTAKRAVAVSLTVWDAVRQLRAFVDENIVRTDARRILARAVDRLLVTHEVGSALTESEQGILDLHVDACGATHGDAAVGEAISVLLSEVSRDGAWLGKVSVASESLRSEHGHEGVRVDLSAIASACEEAIATPRPVASPPEVSISADVLLAVVRYARELGDGLSRLSTSMPVSSDGDFRGQDLLDRVAALAAVSPVVSGAAAADVEGSTVELVLRAEVHAATTPATRPTPPLGDHQRWSLRCVRDYALSRLFKESRPGSLDAHWAEDRNRCDPGLAWIDALLEEQRSVTTLGKFSREELGVGWGPSVRRFMDTSKDDDMYPGIRELLAVYDFGGLLRPDTRDAIRKALAQVQVVGGSEIALVAEARALLDAVEARRPPRASEAAASVDDRGGK